MTTVLFIHGAGASMLSFAFLSERISAEVDTANFHYDIEESVASVSKRLRAELHCMSGDVVLLGHSLGGLIATLTADHPAVSKVVTLCAPFGGIASSALMTMLNPSPLFRDTSPYGSIIRSLRFHGKPHLAFYATSGLPLLDGQPNDGVVSVASQRALQGPHYVEVECNHFEVLLCSDIEDRINQFIA